MSQRHQSGNARQLSRAGAGGTAKHARISNRLGWLIAFNKAAACSDWPVIARVQSYLFKYFLN